MYESYAEQAQSEMYDDAESAGAITCPKCSRSCEERAHDSAYCGRCFLSFRPSDPMAALPAQLRLGR